MQRKRIYEKIYILYITSLLKHKPKTQSIKVYNNKKKKKKKERGNTIHINYIILKIKCFDDLIVY
jgi:hypothetical protein